LRYQNEIAQDGETKTEPERVSVHLGNADQRRGSQLSLEIENPLGFLSDRPPVPSGPLPTGAKYISAGANAQNSRLWLFRFRAQLQQHGVKHFPRNFISLFGVVQGETEHFPGAFDDYPNRLRGTGSFGLLCWHEGKLYNDSPRVNRGGIWIYGRCDPVTRFGCPGFAESHAAAIKHNVITIEKAMGMTKRYFQLRTVIAAKQRANAQVVPRMSAKVAAGRPPNCHANIAENR